MLPQSSLDLVYDQLNRLISAPPRALGLGVVISLLLALWYSMSGTGTLMQALTVAYEERDTREILGYYMEIGGADDRHCRIRAAKPVSGRGRPGRARLAAFPEGNARPDRVRAVADPGGAADAGARGVLPFCPARRNPCWHLFSVGTIAAALVWLAGSAGFSYYVANFSSYDKTYGSLGTVVVLLMWLYLGAFVVLVGAELNSEIEQARAGGTQRPDEQCPDPGFAPGRARIRRAGRVIGVQAVLCSCSRGISSTKLHGRKRLSSWWTRMSCHASRQALGRAGQCEQIGAAGDPGRARLWIVDVPIFAKLSQRNSSPKPAISFS